MRLFFNVLIIFIFAQSCADNQQATTATPEVVKLSACDWSIGKQQTPEAMVFAKELGLDGIQVSFNGGKFDLRKKEVRLQYRQKVKETGVGFSSLAMVILNSVPFNTWCL